MMTISYLVILITDNLFHPASPTVNVLFYTQMRINALSDVNIFMIPMFLVSYSCLKGWLREGQQFASYWRLHLI